MTEEQIEFAYDLSRDEARRAAWTVQALSTKRAGRPNYFISHAPVKLTLIAIFAVILAAEGWIILSVAAETGGGLESLFKGKLARFVLLWLIMFWALAWWSWGWMFRILSVRRRFRLAREGVDWGPIRLTATAEILNIELTENRLTHRWSTITDLHETKEFLILSYAPSRGHAIPRRAFESAAAEDAFVSFVEAILAKIPR